MNNIFCLLYYTSNASFWTNTTVRIRKTSMFCDLFVIHAQGYQLLIIAFVNNTLFLCSHTPHYCHIHIIFHDIFVIVHFKHTNVTTMFLNFVMGNCYKTCPFVTYTVGASPQHTGEYNNHCEGSG